MQITATRTRPHVRPLAAPAKRAVHRRDIQEEFLRELATTSGLRVRSRPVVLRRTVVGRPAS